MHILQFKAERTKNLKVVAIDSDGKNIILSGANGQGKSNILNIITSTLTGTKLEDPIKHGEENAEAFIDCGEFKVRKRWTAKGEYIQIVMANGDVKSKPMEFLSGIVGKISFDPMAFKDMKPADQRELLKQLLGLDFSDIEAERKESYDARSEINSQIKGAIAQIQNADEPDPKTPDEEISFKDELNKINELREKRTNYLKANDKLEDRKEYLGEVNGQIESTKIQIENLQNELSTLHASAKDIAEEIREYILPPQISEDKIIAAESSLQDIEAKNVAIRKAKRYHQLIRESNKLKEKSDEYSQKISRLDQDKSTRIANAKFPIDGMSMSDEDVMYNGNRFSILSDGEKMRVSTAMGMALNPQLKVIFIRHANDLDRAGKIEILNMAKEKGYQVWMEVVDESGEIGYFIEDGSISKIDGKEVEQPTPEEQREGA